MIVNVDSGNFIEWHSFEVFPQEIKNLVSTSRFLVTIR